MTRLERQKRELERLCEQFKQITQSNKSELQERRKIFEQKEPHRGEISRSENTKITKEMAFAEYQQALKTLQKKLDESTQRENAQKLKIKELK